MVPLVVDPAGEALAGLRVHLDELAQRMHALIDEADGVGATLLVEGHSVFGGSNPFTNAIDQVQYSLGQGPCLSAVESREVVRSRTIGAGESRWACFTSRAAALELRSVASVPVRADREVVGSLNLYSRHQTMSDALDTTALLRHAELTGRAMMGARLLTVSAAIAEVLANAERDREDIDIAVGLVMDRYTMTASHARILIGQLAAQDQVTVGDAAGSLIGRPRPPARPNRAEGD